LIPSDHGVGSDWPARHLSQVLTERINYCSDDGKHKRTFDKAPLPMFWMKIKPEYPDVATRSLKSLLPFSKSYLCEAGFSVVAASNQDNITKKAGLKEIHCGCHCLLSPQGGTPFTAPKTAADPFHYKLLQTPSFLNVFSIIEKSRVGRSLT